MKYKNLDTKDYGKIAIGVFILAGLTSITQQHSFLTNIFIIVGLISGIIWLFKTVKKKHALSKKTCDRCGLIDNTKVYDTQGSDTTREYFKLTGSFPFEKSLNLCFSCILAHELFVSKLSMFILEKSLRTGRYDEILQIEKDLGKDQGIFTLALLYLAYENMDFVRRVLVKEDFIRIKPWLDKQLSVIKSKNITYKK